MKAQMRGLHLRPERNKAHLVTLAHLFKRPANARIARVRKSIDLRRLAGPIAIPFAGNLSPQS
jgi:hypothetical protein